jgi:hypothetical protein
LGLVLYFGAARYDASPEQVEALREQVLPLMRSVYLPTGNEKPVLDGIRAVMGEGWLPNEEWRAKLAALGRDERGARQ